MIDVTMKDAVTELITCAIDAGKSAESVWSKTGAVITENTDLFESSDLTKKERAKSFTKLLDDNCDLDAIDEEGMSRTGETILLRKKNNKIKWSSWSRTSRMMQNTSDIFKGIEELGYDIVFPEGIIVSRYELLAMLKEAKGDKAGESPLDTITRCLELVGKKVIECEKADQDAIEQRLLEVQVIFTDWKKAVK